MNISILKILRQGGLAWAATVILAFQSHAAPGGTLVAWGDNYLPPAEPRTRFKAIAAGANHSLALTTYGTVVAWGRNDAGQCVVPASSSNVIAVAGGVGHSLALKADGTLVSWGETSAGSAWVPNDQGPFTAIAVQAGHNLALRADGTVFDWVYSPFPDFFAGSLTNVVAIAAGSSHNMVLKGDGAIVGWGGVPLGDGTVPNGLSNVVAIAAGTDQDLALLSDGTVVAWGRPSCCPPRSVYRGLSNVVAIAAGGAYSLALRADGTVVVWDSLISAVTVVRGLTNVTAISASPDGNRNLAIVGPPATPPRLGDGRYLGDGGFQLTVSTDGQGANWGTPVQLSAAGLSPIPAVGSDHVAYVFWFEGGPSTRYLKVRQVLNRGTSLAQRLWCGHDGRVEGGTSASTTVHVPT